jgi:predicted nucleotidyltransferase component of viral defense system
VIRRRLDVGLRAITPRLLIKARAQRVARKPPSPEKTRPTYEVTVAHAMPGDRFYKSFDFDTRPVPTVVQVEITLNDLVCDAVPRRLAPDGRELLVSTLEDIIAEKLRALLQQQIRNRSRPQDVYDVARAVRRGIDLDLAKISEFLIRKAVIREIHPRKSLFNDTVKSLAQTGYDTLLPGDASEFLTFDEAWSCVLDLVRRLDIPV